MNESFTPEGGTQKTIFINESGLYSLILSSKLPAAKKFKHWVTSEVLPAIRKTGSYTAPAPKSDRELSIEEARILESLIPLCPVDTYRQILASHIARKVTGEFILPLPKAERKSYSAGQVGEMLGVSGNSIGRIANSHGLKTPAYGEWIWDRARNGKQVKSFVYYEDTVDIIRELLGSAA